MTWEYQTAYVVYRSEKIQGRKITDWFIKYGDGTALVGWDEILKTYGGNGWELVSVVGEYSGVMHSVNFTGLRLFFKRESK